MKKSPPAPQAASGAPDASPVGTGAPTASPVPDALRLRREDLLGMEPVLAALLRRVLPFASHSLYFPTPANTPDGPQWLPRERTLLLPLLRRTPCGGEVLGVFTARGVDGRVARRLLPELPALAELCLDHLELERRGRCDALTGLALGRELLGRMAREADMVRQRFSSGGDEDMGPLHRVCMGLLVVRCRDWHALAAETSYAFAESLLVELSRALTQDLPPEALAARTGDDEFAILLSAGSRGACLRLATALLPRLDGVSLPYPMTRQAVRLCCSVGHALYPQDMDAALLPLPMQEQARTLLHKARLAATAAQERFDALLEQDRRLAAPTAEEGREARIMGFGRVLSEGGVIRRALPLGRAETSLGRRTGAREGLRFAVWSQGREAVAPGDADAAALRRCKGEIILVDVREKDSVADIVHWTDPADGPDKGDALTLLPAGGSVEKVGPTAPAPEEMFARALPRLTLAGLEDAAGNAASGPSTAAASAAASGTAAPAPAAGRRKGTPPCGPTETTLTSAAQTAPPRTARAAEAEPCPGMADAGTALNERGLITASVTTDTTAMTTITPQLATALLGHGRDADSAPALLRHGDFIRLFGRQTEGRAAFTLGLVRLCEATPGAQHDTPPEPQSAALFGVHSTGDAHSASNSMRDSHDDNNEDSPECSTVNSAANSDASSALHSPSLTSAGTPAGTTTGTPAGTLAAPAGDVDTRMTVLHLLCRRLWEQQPGLGLRPVLAARYGQASLIFLHAAPAGLSPADHARHAATAYAALCREAAAQGLDIAVGLASWPTLRFTRADMPECCRKALELALLLPQPRVGHFGSLALHISADKRYSQGDIFGAVEEYRLALLADRNNSMAWNSLGVCMAALSRQQEARGHFLKALQGWKRALRQPQQPLPFLPADTTLEAEYAATLYNLGTVCQSLGERRAAGRHFRQCVALQPDHYFAHLRLGQLAEEGGRSRKAREHYEQALHLEDQAGPRGGMARRHLARLAVRGRRPREARELLHEALVRDPQDAAAMGMLAELCLDGGEDPSMAEMLARNCVSLRGNHAPSWRLLSRALRALERHAEADAAEARAVALG